MDMCSTVTTTGFLDSRENKDFNATANRDTTAEMGITR
jgi:hypothetical protein